MTVRGLGALAVVVAIAAGGCSDRTARTTPEPDVAICCPPPPPPPPSVEGVARLVSRPADPDGYITGEKIIVVFQSEEPLSSDGQRPRLRISVGDYERYADFRPAPEDDWFPNEPSRSWRFEYTVAGDDLDLDGISIYHVLSGTFLVDGARRLAVVTAVVSVDVSGDHLQVQPWEDFFSHRVTRPREPRACADERELAMNVSVLAREWDGAPLRVDIVRNFPNSVTEADVQSLLDPLGLLAQRIETRLGYSIIEEGGVIAVPAGASPDRDLVDPAAWEICPLSRDRGQILLYHWNDLLAPGQWWLWPTLLHAVPRCGAIAVYLPRLLDSTDKDAAIVHELFQALGFWDKEVPVSGRGVPMSQALLHGLRPGVESVLWPDLDALRCVFPEG